MFTMPNCCLNFRAFKVLNINYLAVIIFSHSLKMSCQFIFSVLFPGVGKHNLSVGFMIENKHLTTDIIGNVPMVTLIAIPNDRARN